jgi:hypothetical protein
MNILNPLDCVLGFFIVALIFALFDLYSSKERLLSFSMPEKALLHLFVTAVTCPLFSQFVFLHTRSEALVYALVFYFGGMFGRLVVVVYYRPR